MNILFARSLFVVLTLLGILNCPAQSAFNVFTPDVEQLNALVLQKINEKRLKRNALPLEVSKPLQQTAVYFTHNYKGSNFISLRSDRKKYLRKADLVSYKYGYTNTLLNVIISTSNGVDYKGGSFYYDKTDTETNSHLFYGKRPTKKEREAPNFKLYPVADLTYETLADRIADIFLRDRRSLKCLNAGYSLVGCSCKIEEKTLKRNKLPVIKAVFVLGGKRIDF